MKVVPRRREKALSIVSSRKLTRAKRIAAHLTAADSEAKYRINLLYPKGYDPKAALAAFSVFCVKLRSRLSL